MNCLTVPGKPEYLQRLLTFVQHTAEEAGLGQRSVYRLRLAVDEIATNIVLHGYKEANLHGDLTVQFVVELHQIIVHLEDSGAPFDPSQAVCGQLWRLPPHKRPSEGGLGIFIALSNVDDFCYTTDGPRNRSTFIMYRK